ncbi:hypothetical protein [Komagataeibacter europaeus]|uniref:hypothetical protein n=1 Tax=Komagataeibacter europaeus TaxID=33995 RepID=UPI0015F9BB71|nr:hypothetical protein [Komagataeibacter europaeus]
MINEIRIKALDAALVIAQATGAMEASDILKDASLIENYLSVGIVGAAVLPVNDLARAVEPALDLGAGDFPIPDRDSGEFLPVSERQIGGDLKDKTLAGSDVSVTHKASSSAQGGEKPERGATLSGSEIVAFRCSCDLCRSVHGTRDREIHS